MESEPVFAQDDELKFVNCTKNFWSKQLFNQSFITCVDRKRKSIQHTL